MDPDLRVTLDRDDEEVAADIPMILASTKRLLSISRGESAPDERDSQEFKRVFSPHDLLEERIILDADKLMRQALYRMAKERNLRYLKPSHMDPYTTGLLIGNPLSSPIEEINPVQLAEQQRRITQMGPGGLPSEDSITAESQNIHPSEFGFVAAIEGPESSRVGVDVRAAQGTRLGNDGRIYQTMLDRAQKQDRFVSFRDIADRAVAFQD